MQRPDKFNLSLEKDKIKLVRFGRFSLEQNKERRLRQERIYFLGFTIFGDRSLNSVSRLGFVTERSRRRRCKIKIKELTLANRHLLIPGQHRTLKMTLNGIYSYYAIASNHEFLGRLHHYAKLRWRIALSKRSQNGRYTWEMFNRTMEYFPLPRPGLLIPYLKFDAFALL